jgi:hypothetical protein
MEQLFIDLQKARQEYREVLVKQLAVKVLLKECISKMDKMPTDDKTRWEREIDERLPVQPDTEIDGVPLDETAQEMLEEPGTLGGFGFDKKKTHSP